MVESLKSLEMKKIFILAFIAATSIICACTKEELAPAGRTSDGISLLAEIEQQNESKTSLDGTSIVWNEGDSFKLFDENGFSTMMVAQSGGSSVNFKEDESKREQDFNEKALSCAIYPYDGSNASFSDGGITFDLPDTQNYAEGTFGKNANAAVGTIYDGKVYFKNACGYLKLQIKGKGTVTKIVLQGNNNEVLGGTFLVNPADDEPTAVYTSGGVKKIALDCGEGVELSENEVTNFYFVVPVSSFGDETKGGFTAELFCGEKNSEKISTTKSTNVISRSSVRSMPTKSTYLLPEEYIRVEYLEGTGTQYITGPEVVPAETTVELKVSCGNYIPWTNQSVFGSWDVRDGTGTATRFRVNMNVKSDTGVPTIGCGLNGTYSGTYYPLTQSDKENGVICIINQLEDGEHISYVKGHKKATVVRASSITQTNSPYIFADHGAENCKLGQMRIHFLKYFPFGGDAETPTHYLVPAVRSSDMVAGLYDVVSEFFYTNAGIGNFRISASKWEQWVEVPYLESDGSAYVKGPEIVPDETTIECEFALSENTPKQTTMNILGSYSGTNCRYRIYLYKKSEIDYALGVGLNNLYTNPYHSMSPEEQTSWLTGVINEKDGANRIACVKEIPDTKVSVAGPVKCTLSPYIFYYNSSSSVSFDPAKVRIRSIKYYPCGGSADEPTHLLKPARGSWSGVLGFLDTVTGEIYTATGSGSLLTDD